MMIDEKKIFDSIMNNKNIFVVAIDTSYNIIFCNKSYVQYIKNSFNLDIKIGSNFLKYFTNTLNADKFYEAAQASFNGQEKAITFNSKLGEKDFYFQMTFSSIIDDNSEIIGTSIQFENITEIKLKEIEYINYQSNLNSLLDSAPNSYFLFNNEYKIIAFNKKSIEIIKLIWNSNLKLGDSLHDIAVEPVLTLVKANINRAFNGEEHSATRSQTIDGVVYWLEARYIPIKNINGEIINVNLNISDISEKKRIEEELIISQRNLEAILESNDSSMFLLDKDMNIVNLNRYAKKMIKFLWNREAPIGDNILKYSDPEWVHDFTQYFNDALKNIASRSERIVKLPDHGVAWFEMQYLPVLNSDGEVENVTFTSTNIDSRKQVEIKLKESINFQNALLNGTDYSIISTDINGTIITFNKGAENILGYLSEEMVNLKSPAVFHKIDEVVERAKELSKEYNTNIEPGFEVFVYKAKLGEVEEREWTYIKKDGTEFPVLLTVSAVMDGEKIYGFVGIAKDITIQKLNEALIRQSDTRFKTITETAPLGIYILDLDYNCIYANPKYIELTTLSYEEIIGKGWKKCIHPEDKEFIFKKWDESIEKEEFEFDYNFRFIQNDNNIIWVSAKASQMRDENRILGYVVTIEDITEDLNYIQKIEESDERTKALINAIPDVIIRYDAYGNILDYKASQDQVAIPIFEVKGENLFVLHLSEDLEKATKEAIEKVLQNDEIITNEFSLIVENEIKYYDARFVRSGNDEVINIIRDISVRKGNEEKLIENQKFIESITNSTPNLIMINNIQTGLPVYQNRSFALFMDYTNLDEKELGENAFLKLIHEDDTLKFLNSFDIIKSLDDDDVYEYEFRLKNKSNKWHWINSSNNVFTRDSDGNVILSLATLQDITERKIAEEQLIKTKDAAESANRAKSSFLANMSHEIRTPMNAILGFAEILSKSNLESSNQEFVNTILSSGRTLLKLINDVLDLSKIEAGKLKPQFEMINLVSIVNEMKQVFSLKSKENNIDFIINIQNEFPDRVFLDELRIRQILINLIGNAFKFTQKGYIKLDLKFAELNNKLINIEFTIEDTGIGIPIEQQELVFEAFRQQDEQNTRRYGGTGLGLTITKRLIELMNGRISLTSSVGKGSIFKIEFFELEAEKETKPLENSIENSYNNYIFTKNKLLLVEDLDFNQTIVLQYLKSFNFQIKIAENGLEALEILENYSPDLILMDIQMPEMDGFTATEIIKKDDRFKHVPIIATTASVMKEEINKIKMVFDEYLAKPFTGNELIEKLIYFLGESNFNSPKQINIIECPETLGKEKLQFLSTLISKEMINLCKKLQNGIEIEEIHHLSQNLFEISEKSSEPNFKEFGLNLIELANSFEIDKTIEKLILLENFFNYTLNS